MHTHRKQHLSLTNDGSLTVFFLGCGSAFSKKNFQTNFLIVKGQDHLLVDCGTTCSRALAAAGLAVTDIRNVLITHSHADHAGGLEELMLMNRYVTRIKPRIAITPEYQRILWNQTLRGGAEMNEVRHGRGLKFRDYWEIIRPRRGGTHPREGNVFDIGGITVRTFRTRHYPEQARNWQEAMYSVGLVIDERIFFSGDTQFDDGLIPEVMPAGAQWYFHDTQLFPGGIHASLQEIETLPADVLEKTSLVHYGDNFEDHRDRVARAGIAEFARPGITYDFGRTQDEQAATPDEPVASSAS